MKITEPMMRRIAPNINREEVKNFVAVFNEWAEKFDINTPMRTAMFIANVLHESACLNHFEENLNYSADALMRVWPKRFDKAKAEAYARNPKKIANYVYANRMGNGDEASGDGWRYRGRGAIQLTGKNNVKAYAESSYCVGDLMAHPEWLAKSPGAYKSAMWFWKANGLNLICERGDMTLVCQRINGGLNGLADRSFYFRKLKKEFGL